MTMTLERIWGLVRKRKRASSELNAPFPLIIIEIRPDFLIYRAL